MSKDKPIQRLLKRAFDICGAIVGLIIFSPVLLWTAYRINKEMGSPVFYNRERAGKGGKPFKLYKFRTMSDARDENGNLLPDAERITPIGQKIRSSSIDELPQFFNVLKGDMSLIGPRPEVPFHVNHFKEEIPLYLVRQQVRPGITGWAQVNGLRGDTSIEKRVKYDIWYIENWSLWLDVKILFMTVFGGMKNDEKIA